MSVLKELLESRDELSGELEKITTAVEAEKRDLNEDEESRSKELLDEIDQVDGRIREEKRNSERSKMLAEARQLVSTRDSSDVRVESEPRVYGPDSENSFYNDMIRFLGGPQWPDHHGAQQRLEQWGHQVEREVAHGSKEGRAAEVQLREQFRPMKPNQAQTAMDEVRARGRVSLELKESRTGIATGGGATATGSSGGAAFVTPVFLVSEYAPYREFGRAFADQCNKQTLPSYGMEVYIPAVQGQAAVATQTEGSAVQETDPTFGYLSGALITTAGEVTVSQQLLDRAGPNFSFDRMIFDQLNRDYAPKWDAYVLTQATANATAQTWTHSGFDLVTVSGSGGFYGQIGKAKASIRMTAGTVLNPTHLFLPADRWEYIAAQADVNGRPVVVPDYAGPFNAVGAGNSDGDVGIEGRTGYRLNGLPVFTDQNIAQGSTGTAGNQQALVGDLAEVYVFEGPIVPRVIPQTLASNLQVILQQYSYGTAIVRYNAAIVAITGTGLALPISYTA